jgi:MtN3 and saliva related transmembrane protein
MASIIGECPADSRAKDNPPMQLSDLVGFLAATLTTISFVPQALHTFRTKDVSGISLGMYSAFTVGVALWLVYGILLNAWPVVIANIITLVLAVTILAMKLRYRQEAVGGNR